MIVTSKDSCQAVCIEGEGRFVAVSRCKGLRAVRVPRNFRIISFPSCKLQSTRHLNYLDKRCRLLVLESDEWILMLLNCIL